MQTFTFHRAAVLPLILAYLAAPAFGSQATAPAQTASGQQNCAAVAADHAHDFDFFLGSWVAHNRRLTGILQGSTQWTAFESTHVVTPILDGRGNREEFRSHAPDITAVTLHFYNPATQQWSMYWVNGKDGHIEPPATGQMCGSGGVFEGDDSFDGKPIRARLVWTQVDTDTPHWEQAFSSNGGRTWETNWIGDLRRANPLEK